MLQLSEHIFSNTFVGMRKVLISTHLTTLFCLLLLMVSLNTKADSSNVKTEQAEVFNSKVEMYINIAEYYFKKGQIVTAYNYTDSAENKINDNTSAKEIGKVYFLKGAFNFYMNKHSESIGNLLKSYQFYIKANDSNYAYNALSIVAVNYGQMNNVSKALQYHKKTLNFFEQTNDSVRMSKSYTNLGVLYKDLGKLDKAIYYYSKAYLIDKALKKGYSVVTDLNNFAVVLHDLKQYELESFLLNYSLDLSDAQVNENTRYLVKINSVQYLIETNRINDAKALLKEIEDYSMQNQIAPILSEVYSLKSLIAQRENLTEESYKFFKESYSSKYSLEEIKFLKSNINLNPKIEFETRDSKPESGLKAINVLSGIALLLILLTAFKSFQVLKN